MPMKNKSLYQSFKCAFGGIFTAIREERNTKIHFAAALFVMVLGFLLGLSSVKLAILALTCGLVIACETINTAIERIVDMVKPEYDERAKKIKDISAGAVLSAAITAAFVGIIFFGPVIINFIIKLSF